MDWLSGGKAVSSLPCSLEEPLVFAKGALLNSEMSLLLVELSLARYSEMFLLKKKEDKPTIQNHNNRI